MIEELLVPEQRKGGKTGATAQRELPSTDEAKKRFRSACQRLLNVNRWYEYAGEKGTEFQLTDRGGAALNAAEAGEGDLIRIRIPGPPNKDGDGYDWVEIEAKETHANPEKDEEILSFRVRPIKNPTNHSSADSHFYTDDATSTFAIVRRGHVVYALERGRNEKPNVRGSLLSKVRNFFVGLGAMLGLSIPIWKMWAESMLEE